MKFLFFVVFQDLTISLYEHLTGTQAASTTKGVSNDQPLSDKSVDSNVQFKKCEKQSKQLLCKCDSKSNSVLSSAGTQQSQQEVKCGQVVILGCDLDGELIQRAKKENQYPNNIQFEELDIMDSEKCNRLLTQFLAHHSSSIFDLTTCFSITMWIHLHHGDHGLLEFLQKVSQSTRFLIIEPQPWKCYKSALRRVKKLGLEIQWQSLDNLMIKYDVVEHIEKYLVTECGMEIVERLGETEWERKLLFLKNCKHA